MKKIRLALTMLSVSVALAACGGPMRYVVSSPKDPGADLQVEAMTNKEQGTTEVELEGSNVAPPSRIQPNAKLYVVWERKDQSTAWKKLGVFPYDDSARKGKFKATAAEVKFELVMTAESDASPPNPSSDIVFSQQVGK